LTRIRLVAALVLACALGAARPNALQQKPTMEGYPAIGSPPVVKLVSAGAAPRRALRYSIPANYKGSMDMTQSMEMSMSMMPAPMAMTLNTGLNIAVTSVAANGDIAYSVEFTKASIDGAADNPVAMGMQAAIGAMVGVKGTAVISNRGVSKSLSLGADKAGDPTASQAFDQVKSAVEYLVVPFPEEAIGVGARWEARYGVEMGGMTTFARAEYELTALQGSTATVALKMEQTAPPQNMTAAGLPPEMQMTVERMTGTGAGKTTQPLNSLVPTSTSEGSMSTSMNVNMGGNAMAMTMDIKTKSTTGPGGK
jgi:hypothetical protein